MQVFCKLKGAKMVSRSIRIVNGSGFLWPIGRTKKSFLFLRFNPFPMPNRFPQFASTRKIGYLHWSIIALVSLFVAHLIVTESQLKPTLVLIHQTNYRLAMAVSWPLTFGLMFWIHWFTKKLDDQVPWTENWIRRTILQFLICVLLVLLLNVAAIKVYFYVFDNDFHKSGYMQIEFPIVRWMVLLMNVIYIAWFFASHYFHGKKINEDMRAFIAMLKDKEQQQAFYNKTVKAHLGNKIVMVPLKEIACFEREENIGHVYLLSGKRFLIDMKLYEINEMLGSSSFYQINRSVIISFEVIKGYEKVKNKQGEIILKDGYDLDVSLLISRDRFDSFKEHFDAYEKF
ncbi:MAG: LytTR family transcriptional regulator [Pedobacter sp.]|nr:MAG: LytTR family transcriptional regulator [Pedobacter sp.]